MTFHCQLLFRTGCLLFFLLPSFLFAQDTPPLQADELNIEDIRDDAGDLFGQQVISASRSLQNLSDLPYTIYVITKEEIQEKGYNTLVDALKWIPGIRVSQPGSGTEGETFLMRGLHGNTYTKILINGVPVKPFATRGMPIGAQLPVRQAERIEVIFGPAAALYGTDAAAGVVNIITRQSERPLFIQADIGVGANGFSTVHVLFGGKLGKGKNLLKYNIYGSTTAFDTRDIFQDTAFLYNPITYDAEKHFLESPNYRRSAPNNPAPLLNQTPHLSRIGGFDVHFRNLTLNAQRMYRRDHSSIGLNTSAVSYANPNNFIAETINNAQLSWNKEWDDWGLRINGHFLDFQTDKNSSYTYVHNTLNRSFNLAASHLAMDEEELEMMEQMVFDTYFSGNRYSYSESKEYRLEFLSNFKPLPSLEIVIGGDYHRSNSSIENFMVRPYNLRALEVNDKTIEQWDETDWRGGIFGQAYLSLEKLKGVFSFNYINSNLYGRGFSPRLGLLYALNEKLSLRAFYGEALRSPNAFYFGHFYIFEENKLDKLLVGFNPNDQNLAGAFHELQIFGPNDVLQPEETQTFELGTRWSPNPNFHLDASVFYSETVKFISFEPQVEIEDLHGDHFIVNGYFNIGDTKTRLYGIQGKISYKNRLKTSKVDASLGFSYTQGEEHLPGATEREIEFVREQPDFIGQLRLGWVVTPKIKFYFDQFFISESFSKSLQTREEFNVSGDRFHVEPHYNFDLTGRWNISNNFTAYFTVSNVFNAEYGGLSATGTPDDLLYNPQSGRLWRLGLSYRLD